MVLVLRPSLFATLCARKGRRLSERKLPHDHVDWVSIPSSDLMEVFFKFVGRGLEHQLTARPPGIQGDCLRRVRSMGEKIFSLSDCERMGRMAANLREVPRQGVLDQTS